jgi:hypothetical protein
MSLHSFINWNWIRIYCFVDWCRTSWLKRYVMTLICIRRLCNLSLGQDTYRFFEISWFFSVPSGKFWDNTSANRRLLFSRALPFSVHQTFHHSTYAVQCNILLTDWLHGAETFLGSCQSFSYSILSRFVMEHKHSLPCLDEPSTGPCLETNLFSPYHRILSL